MKRVYKKPMISVEVITLDMPIAANCVADFNDVKSLVDLGYFGDSDTAIGGKCVAIYNEVDWGHDTVCYHSNVQTAFLS